MRCCPGNLQQVCLLVRSIGVRCNCQMTSKLSCHSYPEILRIHVENLASILTQVDSVEVQDQLNKQLQAFAEGEIDHASEAFSSLWRTLTHGRDTKAGAKKNPYRVRSRSSRRTIDPDICIVVGTLLGGDATEDCSNQINPAGIFLRPQVFGEA